MAKTAKGKSQPSTSPAEAEPSGETSRARPAPEQIAVRAYHIYIERGRVEGDPVSDWLQAERELAEASD
jgi:Protein of unknown function (DUF2934)